MLGNLGGESRAISFQSLWGAGDSTVYETQSSAFVDYHTSLQVNAVWACVSLISDTISSLPVDSYVRRDGIAYPYRPKPSWVAKPDVMLPSIAFWQQTMTSLLIDGNAYIRIFRDSSNEIINMMVLNPLAVKVSRNALGQKLFHFSGENNKVLTTDDLLHIAGSMLLPGELRGKSPIETLKENIGLAISLESFAARFFGQGTLTQGIIEYPGALSQEQAENLAKSFDNAHKGYRRAHKTGILSGGASFKATTIANDQAQMSAHLILGL